MRYSSSRDMPTRFRETLAFSSIPTHRELLLLFINSRFNAAC